MKRIVDALTPGRRPKTRSQTMEEATVPSPSPRNAIARRDLARLADSREFFERVTRSNVQAATMEEFVSSLQDGKFLLRVAMHVAGGATTPHVNKLEQLGDAGVSAENFDRLLTICRSMDLRNTVTLADVQAYNISKLAQFFDEAKGKFFSRPSDPRTPNRFDRSAAAALSPYCEKAGGRRLPMRSPAEAAPLGMGVLVPKVRREGGGLDSPLVEEVLAGIANVEEKKGLQSEKEELAKRVNELESDLADVRAELMLARAEQHEVELGAHATSSKAATLASELQSAHSTFSKNLSDMTTALGRSEDRCAKAEAEAEALKQQLGVEVAKWKKVVDDKIMKETDLRKEAEAGREAAASLAAATAEIQGLKFAMEELKATPVAAPDAVTREEYEAVVAEVDALRAQLAARNGALATSHTCVKACGEAMKSAGASLREEFAAAKTDLATAGKALVASVVTLQANAAAADERYLREAKERRRVHNQLAEAKGNIRVFCRVRPASAKEATDGAVGVRTTSEAELVVGGGPSAGADGKPSTRRAPEQSFEFDRVFGPASTQADVFQEVSSMAISALDGFHSCIFAYGQTGAGKTHTMMGTATDPGVNFRTLEAMFEEAGDRSGSHTYTFSVSYVEIYNEAVKDLLGGDGAPLDVRQGSSGVYLPGVTLEPVSSLQDVRGVMDRGGAARSVGATSCNEHSSRSHSLLMVHCHGKNAVSGAVSNGRLVLVDLAGSERVAKSKVDGARLKETQAINKSLAALGNVISALVCGAGHVPFRDSKLTYLLQDSLGKDNKTLMIAQLNPMAASRGESVCTLNFASRVRKVELGKAKCHKEGDDVARLRSATARAREDARAASAQASKLEAALLDAKAAKKAVEGELSAVKAKLKTATAGSAGEVAALQRALAAEQSAAADMKAKAGRAAAAAKAATKALEEAKEAAAVEGHRLKAAAVKEAAAAAAAAERATKAAVEKAVGEVKKEAESMLAKRRKERKVKVVKKVKEKEKAVETAAPAAVAATVAVAVAAAAPATPPAVPRAPPSTPVTPPVEVVEEKKAGEEAAAGTPKRASSGHKPTPFRRATQSRIEEPEEEEEEWTSAGDALNTVLFQAAAPPTHPKTRSSTPAASPKPAGILKAAAVSRFQSIRNVSVIGPPTRRRAATFSKSVTFASPVMRKYGSPSPVKKPKDENRPTTAEAHAATPSAARRRPARATTRALGLPARVLTAARRPKTAGRVADRTTGGWRF